MVYSSAQRRAYYLRRREYHLQYSKDYVNKHREKYLEYYREYGNMKREFLRQFEYRIPEPERVPKLELHELPELKSKPITVKNIKIKKMKTKEPKEKGLCTICNCKFKGSYKQHIATTKHVINSQSAKSKELKDIKKNIMSSDSIKYFEMFRLEDLKDALMDLGHYEVEAMSKEELYAYIITLINADDVEEVSEEESNDEVDYHGVVFKCAYSE
jgi:hypothetical protein